MWLACSLDEKLACSLEEMRRERAKGVASSRSESMVQGAGGRGCRVQSALEKCQEQLGFRVERRGFTLQGIALFVVRKERLDYSADQIMPRHIGDLDLIPLAKRRHRPPAQQRNRHVSGEKTRLCACKTPAAECYPSLMIISPSTSGHWPWSRATRASVRQTAHRTCVSSRQHTTQEDWDCTRLPGVCRASAAPTLRVGPRL